MNNPFDSEQQNTNFDHTPPEHNPVPESAADVPKEAYTDPAAPVQTAAEAYQHRHYYTPPVTPETNASMPAPEQNSYYNQPGDYAQTINSGYQPRAYHENSYTQMQGPNTEMQNQSGNYYGNNAYTWSTRDPTSQPYTQTKATKPKREKKPKGKRTGLKVLAVFLCCLITSMGSLGVFVGLIQNGTIAIDSGDTGTSETTNPAFTINKVVQNEEEANAVPTGSGVSELTKQQIADKLIPSVVCLQVYQNASSYANNYSDYGFGNYGGQYDDSEDDNALEPYSQGSGIIYTADGYVITNAHVVSGADNIKVITSDGETYEAELVGSDSVTDLAVVKILADGAAFTPAEFGSSGDLKVADEVMAIGNPGGIELNSTVTMGYVSALDREVTDSDTGYTMDCIQTDAAINPGNSGGALVNMYGQVVGINSSKIVATGYEGLGFAIPSDTAQPIISDLMEYGYVKDRAMLGITPYVVDSMTAGFYGMSAGLYVYRLNTQEAADSGLLVNDRIDAIDGQEVSSVGSISSYLLSKKPGDVVELTVTRYSTDTGFYFDSGSSETLTIQLVLSQSTDESVTADNTEDNTQDQQGQSRGR